MIMTRTWEDTPEVRECIAVEMISKKVEKNSFDSTEKALEPLEDSKNPMDFKHHIMDYDSKYLDEYQSNSIGCKGSKGHRQNCNGCPKDF